MGEEYRRIKRPLVTNARRAMAPGDRRLRVVTVTSALPGEGKTFTAINLAISVALEKDVQVLLIDGDVAKPNISVEFGLRADGGLLDLLKDESLDPEGLIQDTDLPGLSILPAGGRSEADTELLASARMARLVDRLLDGDPERIVLMDSSPLLVTTESREILAVAGQVVFVVAADATPRQAVYDALTAVRDGQIVGFVLNRVDPRDAQNWHYDYGSYAEHGIARADTGGEPARGRMP